MKKLLFTILLAVIALTASAQKLIDVYKRGIVKLVPDLEYAQGNNWDNVFKTYYDTIYSTPMGNRKSLKILPDGSVIVNHTYRNFYSKFSPTGKFEKEFGIINNKGEQYKKINAIEGIINNNTFFSGLDNMGNMICFDFNGNYKKTLKLNYMTRQMIPLPNNKIAVVGWVIWSNKFRDFVSIVDYETNEEKVIWEYFTERPSETAQRTLFNYPYRFKKGGMMSCTTMPFSKNIGMNSPPNIACVGNKLIIAIPITGELLVHDLEGKLISKDKIEWAKNYISVDEQKEIQQKAIEKYKNSKSESLWGPSDEMKSALEYMIKEMEIDLTKISEPIPMPAFSTIIKDSDGNLLFFEYPKEENANKFNVWVYENGGKFVCQSSFICDEYNLAINPSKMVFSNGYIYGLQLMKKTTGVPLRLVRFKVTSN
ncbi:MAG: hypothetical protein Q7T72_10010 [Bacteroidales bacterium]|nr:hypothetical protein [Bacteroidales bacterium]MDP3002049.1 hypothetical protein [Bacteroidales bacterium]